MRADPTRRRSFPITSQGSREKPHPGEQAALCWLGQNSWVGIRGLAAWKYLWLTELSWIDSDFQPSTLQTFHARGKISEAQPPTTWKAPRLADKRRSGLRTVVSWTPPRKQALSLSSAEKPWLLVKSVGCWNGSLNKRFDRDTSILVKSVSAQATVQPFLTL